MEKRTYKEMCKYFGEEPVSGSKLQTQVSRWNNKYEIEKVGRYYTIIKEYTEEEIQLNKINGLYQKLFTSIIANILSKQNNYACYSVNELIYKVRMVNPEYKYIKSSDGIVALSQLLNLSEETIVDFNDKTYKILSDLIRDIIKSLADKKLLISRQGYRLYKNYANVGEKKTYSVPLNSELEQRLLKIESDSLFELNLTLDNKKDLYKTGQLFKYYDLCNKKLKEYLPEWDKMFICYHLSFNSGLLESYATQSIYETMEDMKTLNKNIQDKILTSKVTKEIQGLEKLVKATIDINRPYKELIVDKVKYVQEEVDEIFNTINKLMN